MGRRNRRNDSESGSALGAVFTCGNMDCKLCGKKSHYAGKCVRCAQEKITWQEWEWWGVQLEGHSDVPSPETYIALPRKVEEPVKSDTFTCPSATMSGCPVAPKPELRVPVEMYDEWVYLCKEFNTEWIAYLQGKELGPNRFEITGMTFPRQEANGVHCEVHGEEKPPEGTIAAVHSHVDMAVFFSAEDEKHFNHRFELVVNRKGEVRANALSTLDCGRLHRGDARVLLVGAKDNSLIKKQLEEKLVERKVVTTFSAPSNGAVHIGRHGLQ